MDELETVPARDVSVQKNMRIPRGILYDLDKLKHFSPKLTHNYVAIQILNAVLPRILEKINAESIISLDGITVRL
jgi:hypothetical protein